MTTLYFIRHAQSDITHTGDDRSRPLTPLGMEDRHRLPPLLAGAGIQAVLSSPYRRAMDTVAPLAALLGLDIVTDERLRERKGSPTSHGAEMARRRWEDFSYNEDGGECLADVQARNMEAVRDILAAHNNKTVAVGTHGTALSTIFNFYDPRASFQDFVRIWHWMPYVARMDFDGQTLVGKEELFYIERGY